MPSMRCSGFAMLLLYGSLTFCCRPALGQSAGNAPAAQGGDSTSQSAEGAPLNGEWKLTWTTKKGTQRSAMMHLSETQQSLRGTLETEAGMARIVGAVQGNRVVLTAYLPKRNVLFSGTISDDHSSISGTTENSAWSATR